MSEFEKKLKELAERSILKVISEGGWIAPDYGNRIQLPRDLMLEVWGMVDRDALKICLKERIEQELADRIVNHIAAELATDIKQILSVTERREAVRALAREHMEAIIAGFEADKVPFTGSLEVQPIDRSAQINAFGGRIAHAGDCNAGLSHSVKDECGNIPGILRYSEGAGDETRTRDVLLGKKGFYAGIVTQVVSRSPYLPSLYLNPGGCVNATA